jgi:hypothetical protein
MVARNVLTMQQKSKQNLPLPEPAIATTKLTHVATFDAFLSEARFSKRGEVTFNVTIPWEGKEVIVDLMELQSTMLEWSVSRKPPVPLDADDVEVDE